MRQFNFGRNWQRYSEKALDTGKLELARLSLKELLGEDEIKNKSFLDIGSGSGIFAISAKNLKASKVVGFDISKESITTARENAIKFNMENMVEFYQGSILEDNYKKFGKFDVVYSWGVLHHTGNMWQAIKNSMELVDDNGLLAVAIYNKHWSSPVWKKIKYFYNVSPLLIKKVMVFIFYWIIFIAKFMVTFKNPFKKRRGMSFYYDVIDWLGGYPYEYATKEEINNFASKYRFKLVKFNKAGVPTGCNEFVFKKCNQLKI